MDDGLEFLAFLGGFMLLFVGLVAAAIFGVTVLDRSQTSRACVAFEQQTGRETEFMSFTWWTYDCMVRTERGWVGIDAVVGTEQTR